MVYFTNPASTVHLESKKIPVFSENEDGGREIYNYILNYENKRDLDEKEISRVVNAIERNMNQQRSNNKTAHPYVTDYDILKNKYQQRVMEANAANPILDNLIKK